VVFARSTRIAIFGTKYKQSKLNKGEIKKSQLNIFEQAMPMPSLEDNNATLL
jgi:hypothetical protein